MSAVPHEQRAAWFGFAEDVSFLTTIYMRTAFLVLPALLASSGGAYADQDKNESGKGKSQR